MPGVTTARFRVVKAARPAGRTNPDRTAAQTALADARAAALYENSKNDDKKHTGNNSYNRDAIH